MLCEVRWTRLEPDSEPTWMIPGTNIHNSSPPGRGTAGSLVAAPAKTCAAYPVTNRGKTDTTLSARFDREIRSGRPLNNDAGPQSSGHRDKRGVCWL